MADSVPVFIRPSGQVECLYNEALHYSELGKLQVRRASTVEFDEARQVWAVVEAQTESEIYSSTSRQKCLEFERGYFNALLGRR